MMNDNLSFLNMKNGEVEKLDPNKLGIKLPKNVETSDVLKDSVEINKAVLSENAPEEFKNWSCFTASILLVAYRKSESPEEALELSREALNGISS